MITSIPLYPQMPRRQTQEEIDHRAQRIQAAIAELLQLRANEAIFPKNNKKDEYSRFQHLGKAGSQAHIDGVLFVVRRVLVDELTQAIDGLKESWLDLYSDEEKVGHRVE